jgi:3',5'-nucleoside bisphosphate phosphatase
LSFLEWNYKPRKKSTFSAYSISIEQINSWQAIVDKHLPDQENDIEYFGEQFIVDETGEFIRREKRRLIASVVLSLEQAVAGVSALGGLVIPAHVNRRSFSLISNLGFIPPHLMVDGVEISRNISPDEALRTFPQLKNYPLLQGGDAHSLSDLLGANYFVINHPSLSEIRLALIKQEGRTHYLGSGNI